MWIPFGGAIEVRSLVFRYSILLYVYHDMCILIRERDLDGPKCRASTIGTLEPFHLSSRQTR